MSINQSVQNEVPITPFQGIYKRGYADGYRAAIKDLTEKYNELSRPWEPEAAPVAEPDVAPAGRSVLIDELRLETHAYNVLQREGILTVEELLKYSDGDLRHLKGVGVCTAIGIRMTLEGHGYFLRGDGDAGGR